VEKLYRCGDCPVCSFMGDLVLLEAIGTRALFVFCPCCGCTFKQPPDGVEEVTAPGEYAPDGFSVPSREQVRVAIDRGWAPRFLAVFDAEFSGSGGALTALGGLPS